MQFSKNIVAFLTEQFNGYEKASGFRRNSHRALRS
jgi:hypothetical protein